MANPTDRIQRIVIVRMGCIKKCPISIPPHNSAVLLCPGKAYRFSAYVGHAAAPLRPVRDHNVGFEIVEFLGQPSEDAVLNPATARSDEDGLISGTVEFGPVAGVFRIKASFPDANATSATFSRPIRVTNACRGAEKFLVDKTKAR